MKIIFKNLTWLTGLIILLGATAQPLLDSYRQAAKQENSAFKNFSAVAERRLYTIN